MLTIDIITLFPPMFSGPFAESIVRRACDRDLVKINIHNLRNWAINKRGTVDSRPYGGGKGMVLRPEPLFRAVERLKKSQEAPKPDPASPAGRSGELPSSTILLTPQGQPFNQDKAQELSKLEHIILICGHYEGVDERVRKHLVDEEISIGEYILTGGEIPAMVITDTVIRLAPGVLDPEATANESFSEQTGKNAINRIPTKLLEYPQYTQPENFKGWKVPKILLSGNHGKIKKWRKRQAVSRTHSHRPNLAKKQKGSSSQRRLD